MQVNGQHNTIEYNTTVFVHPGSDIQEIKEWKENLIAILQRMPYEANALNPLIQLIVTVLAPHKIFMLKSGGTAAITAETYIDLLIIMPDNKDVLLTELEPVFDIASLKHQRVRCSLHSANRVKESIERGNIFYSLNCVDKNLVYDDNKYQLSATTTQALRNMKSQAEVTFTLCFKKAVSFFQSAVFLYENNPEPVIAFYLHQAIELTYRAILRSLNGYYKKTHVIRSLKDLARRCAPQLNNIFPDNTVQEKHLLDALENAYLNARYDNQYNIDDKDLFTLFERTKQLLDIAQEMKEQAIASIPVLSE